MMNRRRIEILVSEISARPWFPYVLLFLITLFAAAIRFYRLGAWSFWIDEIYTINHATAHFSTLDLLIDNIPPSRNWIPLSVILTAQVLNQWGVNEFNARLVAAIAGILTVPALFLPVRKMFNTRVALITVLLLAVSPWHIEWSQNARGYTTLLLFYSLALFAFYFAIEKDRPIYLLLFFVLLYFSSSERLIALFILPGIVIYLLALKFLPFEKPVGLRARNIYILLSPVLLLILYQLVGLALNGDSIISSIVNEIVSTFFGKPIEDPFTQAIFMVFKLGIPLVVLSTLSAIYLISQKNRPGMLVASAALIPVALIVLLTPFMFVEERYAFASLPYWLILAAIAVDELLVRMKKMETVFAFGILFMLLGSAMGENLMYFHTNHGNRWDWRKAFAIVQSNLQEGDVVVSTFSEMGDYYLKRDDIVAWDDTNVDTIVNNGQRAWFVVIPDMTWYTGTQDFYWWLTHNARMIQTIYIRTVDNTNLEIYLYDPALYPQMTPWMDPAP